MCELLTSPSNTGSNTRLDTTRTREQSRVEASLRKYTLVVNKGNIENRFVVNHEESCSRYACNINSNQDLSLSVSLKY